IVKIEFSSVPDREHKHPWHHQLLYHERKLLCRSAKNNCCPSRHRMIVMEALTPLVKYYILFYYLIDGIILFSQYSLR
uniref:Uncharacterized protein n=1 Tax=Romanomermis culicivorax TaxID=13658 RepID=A0A915JR50_ROMCU